VIGRPHQAVRGHGEVRLGLVTGPAADVDHAPVAGHTLGQHGLGGDPSSGHGSDLFKPDITVGEGSSEQGGQGRGAAAAAAIPVGEHSDLGSDTTGTLLVMSHKRP
jgi:hypothetical protein